MDFACFPPSVRKAFIGVPREAFLPPELREFAKVDEAIPIGHGQETTKPSIIAEMLKAAEIGKGMKVLEVGSGTGYVLALIEELSGRKAIGIERIEEFVKKANEALSALGYSSFSLHGNGWFGLREFAPYDAIIVSASVPSFPQLLFEQLKNGGTLVYPLAGKMSDYLYSAKKRDGKIIEFPIMPCRFKPIELV